MTQTSPNWFTVVLGGGGVMSLLTLAGGYASFVIKKHIDAIEQQNKNLIIENEGLRRNIENAETELKNAMSEIEHLYATVERIREAELSSDDAARLKRVVGNLQDIKSRQKGKRFEEYKIAARWLDYRKSSWVKDASHYAIQKYSKIVPWQRRKKFKQDITGYLDWVYTSLYVYGHARLPLSRFVSEPIIKSSFPYVSAIRNIIENKDRGDLTVDQSTYLEGMLEELITKIRNKFKD
jgi:hypothetical protein